MLLKRLYHQDKLIFNKLEKHGALTDRTQPEGKVLHVLPKAVRTVQIKSVGALSGRQVFSTKFVDKAVEEGWMTVTGEKIVITGEDRVLVYSITRFPGRYCSHCDMQLPDEPVDRPDQGAMARRHVAENHAGKKSPDKESPSGYCKINAYICKREE